MNIKSASKLIAIIAFLLAGNLALNWLNPSFDLHWIPLSILGFALWVFIDKPFIKLKLSKTLETGVITVSALIFILYIGWIYLGPALQAERLNEGPCTVNSVEKKCYTFNRQNCNTIWQHYENECREEIKAKVLAQSPSTLTGPMTRRCIYKRLDSSFQSGRRTSDDPICIEHFKKIDSLGY